jgi:hypothetical protein
LSSHFFISSTVKSSRNTATRHLEMNENDQTKGENCDADLSMVTIDGLTD